MPGPKPPGLVAAAALAVAEGQSIPAWAKAHNLSPRTVQKWARKPAFAARVEAIRNRLIDEAVGIMAAGATTAAVQLRILAAEGESEQVRLGAARALLADLMAVQGHADLRREIRDIRARLDAAEAKGGARGKPQK